LTLSIECRIELLAGWKTPALTCLAAHVSPTDPNFTNEAESCFNRHDSSDEPFPEI
jgi:hypothetical protein